MNKPVEAISLYDIANSKKESGIIGDSRNQLWKRLLMTVIQNLLKNPSYRVFAMELSHMAKNDRIDNELLEELLSSIDNDMSKSKPDKENYYKNKKSVGFNISC